MTSNSSLELKLTKSSTKFLKSLYTKLHKIKSSIPEPSKSAFHPTSQHKFTKSSVKHLIYLSPQLYKHLQKLTHKTTFSFNNINITLYTPSTTSLKTVKTTLLKLYTTIQILKTYINNTNQTYITFYLTPAKKVLPKTSTHPLGPNEVNSGSAMIISNPKFNGVVNIWRKEELMRVTIHEIFHSLKADYSLVIDPQLNNTLSSHYNLPPDNNINANEAYNEFNALLFTAALSAPTYNKFIENLIHERIRSIKLATRVIQYQNTLNNLSPNSSPNWLFTPHIPKSDQPTFYQNTNVFSYYVAKTALLYNLNQYLKFLSTSFPTYPIYPLPSTSQKPFFPILNQSLEKFRPTLTKLTTSMKYPPQSPSERSLAMTVSGAF